MTFGIILKLSLIVDVHLGALSGILRLLDTTLNDILAHILLRLMESIRSNRLLVGLILCWIIQLFCDILKI